MRDQTQIFQRTAVVCLLGFGFFALGRAGLDSLLRTGTFGLVYPGMVFLQKTGSVASSFFSGWIILSQGGSQLAQLERERADAASQSEKVAVLEKENALLRAELGRLGSQSEEVTVRLYGHRDRWFIDAGCKEGVQTGKPLTREGSLVGEVQRVTDQFSVVRTLRDPSWRLPVQIGTESARGLFQVATGMPEVHEIPAALPVHEGDSVITLGGEFLRPGLLVGKVSSIREEAGTGTKHAQVVLSYEPERVPYVQIEREEPACL